ncbi:MAG TPA: ribonuclease P protein component [Bacilli bacterium]|nr:ribonuclease P protein component [Bacilli bacterium]
MKKINVLKENSEFNKIIKNNKSFNSKYCYIYKENSEGVYNFGISVSKKIGNAVTRNLYKRRIRSIIDKKKYKKSFKCVIILKKSVLNATYEELEISLLEALEKLNLIKE